MTIPRLLNEIARAGAAIAVSISGGKDSQAMLNRVVEVYCRNRWTGPLFAVHADLGRAEWIQTPQFVQHLAYVAGIPLRVVRRPQGDLVQQIHDRMVKLAGSGPHWPSAKSRYCTSDQKRGQIDKVLNQYPLVISVEGIRAEESPDRAKKSFFSIRKRITAKHLRDLSAGEAWVEWQRRKQLGLFDDYLTRGPRLALTWYPLFDWTEAQVYEACGHSIEERNERWALAKAGNIEEALTDWWMHPAYALGSTRLSCAICILATVNNISVGAQYNPWLLREYQEMEIASGFTFKNNFSLQELEL